MFVSLLCWSVVVAVKMIHKWVFEVATRDPDHQTLQIGLNWAYILRHPLAMIQNWNFVYVIGYLLPLPRRCQVLRRRKIPLMVPPPPQLTLCLMESSAAFWCWNWKLLENGGHFYS